MIAQQPGVNLDDRLRAIPGFTLFQAVLEPGRESHVLEPGVSLRGLGSSGASRTLILLDGVPLNDPFGGWVYWTRVAPSELERVEVSRGAATSVFGDRAMSGAITLFPARARYANLEYDGGIRDTHMVTLGGGYLWNRFAARECASVYD